MKNYSLDVFENFKCINKECKHNCCLKWEIDIDKKTLKKYQGVKDGFKEQIEKGVDFKNSRFFMKEEKGIKRCYFLNDQNLCEIIINKGEKYLCDVCKYHPRFRNFIGGVLEWGVGLACPESARLITEKETLIKEVKLKEDNKKGKNADKQTVKNLKFRKKLFLLIKKGKSINSVIDKVFRLIKLDKQKFFEKDFKNLYLSLEFLDLSFKEKLEKTNFEFDKLNEEFCLIYKNILIYFLYRYLSLSVDNLDLISRTLFSVLSLFLIDKLREKEKDIKEVLINYSTEIEYNEDDLFKILDFIDQAVIVKNKV